VAAFSFANHEFQIVGNTGLYWPSHNALIVADLHLEKASWFATKGQMLPPYDSQATLERLAALITQTGVEQIWCLGDNFHDEAGPDRMAAPARDMLASLTAATDWHWITGNHDERLPTGIGGTVHDEAELGGLILRHRAHPIEMRPELSGHWHPKMRAVARGRGVTRPCFVMSTTRLILPAFGALTGGMAADHPEITALTGKAEALLVAGGRAARFPLF
jgi:uncharacterized protein